ncbi:MAG: 2-oxo acid dehydrogenase subunit E2 [Butyrivibrio sp.]|uniref:2-oxo acid dehydrogenase subunit E2 n=1 Tax=Butyrivibrio sp. TaxID=28121 RepID=UPI001B13EAA4|nr:2-oxo acid dehydrogenase subunit E2 [Butyrivibrio sp.]MBO6239902.1 2-oxo acid dehydrogenase subunit E2 [Butyrivibrio sp.]
MKRPVVDYRKLRLSNITSKEYRHLLLLIGWIAYFFMYFVTERLIPESRCHIVHSPVDDIIPFNEYFVLFYVSWYFFMAGSLLVFALYDIESFLRAQKIIVGMQIISVITYIVWPTVQYLRPDHFEYTNFCTWILGIIYGVDTPTGVCPSLHVGYTLAVLSAWITWNGVRLWKKAFITIWGFLICISVCFVKQHSFTDVWAAVVLYLFLEVLLFWRNIKLGKRRLGDRSDGVQIRDIDAMHYVMPLMYPNRCDNEAYMKLSVDISKTEDYIKKYNENHPESRVAIFDIIIAAMLKTLRHRPQMNRFIANQTMYQRNAITAAFTVKKEFRDDGDETLARIVAEDTDTLESISFKVRDQIAKCKVQDDESTDAMNFIKKLPAKHCIGAAARFLDRHGWMPKSVIATDPYQCSVVLTNLGSLGMDIGYHHLMNWGTNSIFVIVGTKKYKPYYDKDGNVTMKRVIDLAITLDERISDGFYYGRSLRLVQKLIENPELLESELSKEI